MLAFAACKKELPLVAGHLMALQQCVTQRHRVLRRVQVRRLASACLARLFAVGDMLPLFARVAAFQAFLSSREALARAVPAPVRAGVLQAGAAPLGGCFETPCTLTGSR